MRRILVVAHQTVASEDLASVVRTRMADGPCEFTLLVPMNPQRDLASKMSAFGAMEVGLPASQPQMDPSSMARGQLEAGVAGLRRLGATADGEVGPEDPLDGIRDLVARKAIDEIIISTLPKRISRWLHQDLPRKVERKFKLPVTVVTPA